MEEGQLVLKEVLGAIRRTGLTLRPSKCSFLVESVMFLGHNVSWKGITPGDEKTQCINEFPKSTNAGEVR